MSKDFRSINTKLISKQGISIATPANKWKQFMDLKDLLVDMYTFREQEIVRCPTYERERYTNIEVCKCNLRISSCDCQSRKIDFSYGAFDDSADDMIACSCNSQKQNPCDCQTRTIEIKSFKTVSSDGSAIIDGKTGETWCEGVGMFSAGSISYITSEVSPVACECNLRENLKSSNFIFDFFDSDCNMYGYFQITCDCRGRSSSANNICSCDGRCSCDTVTEFSPNCDCLYREYKSDCECEARLADCSCKERLISINETYSNSYGGPPYVCLCHHRRYNSTCQTRANMGVEECQCEARTSTCVCVDRTEQLACYHDVI